MRTFLIALGGGTVTAGSFALSRLYQRSGRDLFIFIAIVALVLTVGLVAASGFAAWQERHRQPRVLPVAPRISRRARVPGSGKERCGSCRRPMKRLGGVWVCPNCDRVPV